MWGGGRDVRKLDRKEGTKKITISWLMEELSGISFERERQEKEEDEEKH